MEKREKVDCVYFLKCSSRNSGDLCEKCKNNRIRNKKDNYFEKANDKPIPDICPKISCQTFDEYFSEHTIRHVLGYECPVCGKYTVPPRECKDLIDCFHCGYELNINMLKGQ